MNLKDWLVPREEKFFDMLEEQSRIVIEGSEALVAMLEKFDDVREHKRKIKEIEHRGDLKTHDLYEALNKTFITPIDREDIATLGSALDDVLDFIWDTAKHLYLYEIKQPPKQLVEIARHLRDQTKLLHEALVHLREPSERGDLRTKLIEIHRLENLADELTDQAKAELFHSGDAMYVVKMKDIYEYIETATDKCEDAADVIRDVLVKHQ